jgi:hypothetical protein
MLYAHILTAPTTSEIRQLVHALREPVGAFMIYLSLLDDHEFDGEARQHLKAMLEDVSRMSDALAEITRRFGLELGDSTPLAMIARTDRRRHGDLPRAAERLF